MKADDPTEDGADGELEGRTARQHHRSRGKGSRVMIC